MELLLEASNLTKIYKRRMVVDHVSLKVHAGEIVGLLGKNGAGKTTTFRMIIGMIVPDKGQVYFRGEEITKFPMYQRTRRGIGYLSQEEALFRQITVEQNVLAILEALKMPRNERILKSQKALEDLGIWHLRKNLAGTLSGGERKRLEISRVMSLDPKLILLDEPFAAVDPIARGEIKDIIEQLKEQSIGILITDHNEREILSSTERSYIMDGGEILTSGTTAEIVKDPIALERYLGKDYQFYENTPKAGGAQKELL